MSALPAFIDLLAFDAAARHGSFTRAAAALNVSQPAISRRVGALEADLGVRLFSRETKPMQLTPDGLQLFEVLRSGLSRLETLVQEIRGRHHNRAFTIAAGPGFLTFWLIPRLPELRAAFPALDLRIMTGDQSDAAIVADIHIRFGEGGWPGVETRSILGESVYAVCNPVYLQGRKAPIGIEALKHERLLQLSDYKERWYEWRSWFEALDSPAAGPLNTFDFDSYALLIGAALAGQGIALCWEGLLDRYLENGSLMRISDEALASSRGYHATFRLGAAKDETARQVARWFAEAAGAVSD